MCLLCVFFQPARDGEMEVAAVVGRGRVALSDPVIHLAREPQVDAGQLPVPVRVAGGEDEGAVRGAVAHLPDHGVGVLEQRITRVGGAGGPHLATANRSRSAEPLSL